MSVVCIEREPIVVFLSIGRDAKSVIDDGNSGVLTHPCPRLLTVNFPSAKYACAAREILPELVECPWSVIAGLLPLA